jgi:hypothetical protein
MKYKFVIIPILVIGMLLLYVGVGISKNIEPSVSDTTEGTGDAPVLLQYQGRLTNPSSGSPVSDGGYTMVFRLYAIPTGGTALWTETRNITVSGGLFNTVLGEVTPLTRSLFNGQALWLGVKVGTDDEALPRQQLLPVAYALSLVPGAVIQTTSGSAALQVTNLGNGEALRVSGLTSLNGNLTVSGVLTAPGVTYTSPRTHYYSLSSEAFLPGSNVDYYNTYGNGGAYIVSGSGALVAPVNLPDGAVVTEFKVFFYDGSSADMSVSLEIQTMSGGYITMANVNSTGTPGYYNSADTTISSATIDNSQYGYLIYAYSSTWDSNLKIKGVAIKYTLSEAP